MHDTAALILELYQIGTFQFGHFTLKSGKKSRIYVNIRRVVSYPFILRSIANALWKKVAHCEFDLICGVPYTALPIATCISLDHHIPMVLRRKEKKDYGNKQLIEGQFSQEQKCLVVEDVVTTGSSILETAAELENVGLIVRDVVALIDREEEDASLLRNKYSVHTVLKLSYVLQVLMDSSLLNPSEKKIVEEYLQGVKE